jgi:hypothetical protein
MSCKTSSQSSPSSNKLVLKSLIVGNHNFKNINVGAGHRARTSYVEIFPCTGHSGPVPTLCEISTVMTVGGTDRGLIVYLPWGRLQCRRVSDKTVRDKTLLFCIFVLRLYNFLLYYQ